MVPSLGKWTVQIGAYSGLRFISGHVLHFALRQYRYVFRSLTDVTALNDMTYASIHTGKQTNIFQSLYAFFGTYMSIMDMYSLYQDFDMFGGDTY